ncbi:MAG: hypothetical protein ACK5MH_00590 [Bacteroidales bacterium]
MGKQGVTYEISALDKASKTFRAVEIQSDKTKRSVDNLNNGTKGGGEVAASAWGKTNSVLKNTAVIAGGIVALRFGYSVGKDAIMATAQIEKYNVTLKTMLGSTTAARDRMQEYLDIAKKTPYELYQVVETGNQLQAIGRYSRQNLEMLGDLAAASGKPMEQVMNAYAKLATNQKGEAINMFRDLLISDDDWIKATGKVKSTTEQMIAALPKIMKDKGFFGMMAAQAETTEGKLSNAKDAVFTLSDALGERLKPTTDDAISAFTKWVGITEDWIRIPTAQKIADEKVQLNMLVRSLMDANSRSDERKNIIDELQRRYPEFVKNLDLEKSSNEDVAKALEKVNKEYQQKIKLSALSDFRDKEGEKLNEVTSNLSKAQAAKDAKVEMTRLATELNKYAGIKGTQINSDKRFNELFSSKHQGDEEFEKQRGYWLEYKSNRKLYNEAVKWHGLNVPENELDGLIEEYKDQKSFYDFAEKKYLEEVNKNIGEAVGGSPSTKGTTKGKDRISPAESVFGDSGSSNSGGGASYGGSGRGSGDAKNVTTHIQNLINGDIVIQTTNLTEGAAEIKRIVIQTLMDATNEIN